MKQLGLPAKRNLQTHTELEQALKPHFNWPARRINFLARFMLALIQQTTINLAQMTSISTCFL
jgi:hypothetical protein